jgi:membrane protease subunit HflC
MKILSIASVIVAIVVLIVLSNSLYVVNETEQVVITQFGDPVGDPITTPGLKAKAPWQTANRFDKRFLEWDGDPNQIPTKDKRYLYVDTYARWRISDPLLFFKRVQNESGAQTRLDDIIDGATRSSVARHDLVEMIRSTNRNPEDVLIGSEEEKVILEKIDKGRNAIVQEILERASQGVEDLGIELIDVRIKRINYIEQVQKDVFARMISELKRIQSEAYREAQEVRGKADGEATRIYAEAYNRDPSFYAFMKSLETYEKTSDPQTTFILTTDSDLLRYIKNAP